MFNKIPFGFVLLLGGSAHAQTLCEYPIANFTECLNKTPRPSNERAGNGCGPAWFPPTLKVPQGAGPASYVDSCNRHDTCYETCNADKARCDNVFERDMRVSCYRAYPYPRSGRDEDAGLRGVCTSRARLYARLVRDHGQSAYDEAQKKDCECCSVPQVYCACNQQCYDSGSDCLSECRTSLGCFAGICAPATEEQCPSP